MQIHGREQGCSACRRCRLSRACAAVRTQSGSNLHTLRPVRSTTLHVVSAATSQPLIITEAPDPGTSNGSCPLMTTGRATGTGRVLKRSSRRVALGHGTGELDVVNATLMDEGSASSPNMISTLRSPPRSMCCALGIHVCRHVPPLLVSCRLRPWMHWLTKAALSVVLAEQAVLLLPMRSAQVN